MRLAFWTVNHRMPVLSKIRVCGSFASGSGIGYSATAPVFGSSLPIKAPVFPVYQMLPSMSSIRPCGPECAVLSGYSLTLPDLGSTRPSTLFICPVYQSEPSLAAIGSCGRAPGVDGMAAVAQAFDHLLALVFSRRLSPGGICEAQRRNCNQRRVNFAGHG